MSKYRWIELSLIVAFWGAIALFTIAYRSFDPHYGEPGQLLPGEAAHAIIIYTVWAILTPGIFWLVRRFGFEGGRLFAHLGLHLFIAVVVAMTMNTFAHASFHTLVATNRTWTFSWSRTLFGFRFLDELIMFVAIVGAGVAREYFFKYRERHEEAGWLRAQLAEARLQALRMQINPHFLFNTLHSISTHLERDPRAVRRMIARLSELFRHSLELNDVNELPLKQELRFIEGYLEIQSIRFPDTLHVSYEVDPDTHDALLPNLILQPLVENAIKHGVSNVPGVGKIVVGARRHGHCLVVWVADNGPGLSSSIDLDDLVIENGSNGRPELGDLSDANGLQNRQRVGLRNTKERLEGLYGDEYDFRLLPCEPSGLRVEISIPYHTAADLHTSAVTV